MQTKEKNMKTFIVVIRSKTQVMLFVEQARLLNMSVRVIPIPKQVKIGCGLCVKINPEDTQKSLYIIRKKSLDAFYGIYSIQNNLIKRIF